MTDDTRPTRPGLERPRFGTDGLRGPWGTPPMDEATLRRVAAALGVWLQGAGQEQKRVVLGHDGRSSGQAIMQVMADGLVAADVACVDVGLVTTPALALVTRKTRADAGVMISASHNPAEDNGIKLFGADGSKLPDDAERDIEELAIRVDAEDGARGRLKPRRELVLEYENHLRNAFPTLDLTGLRLAIDAANGGGANLAPQVLTMLGAEVIATGCTPDGSNINAGVGALHPQHLAAVVRREGAHLGICLDGDGDRGIFVDELGNVHDGDSVLAAMAPHMAARGALPGNTVVTTVMSNLGLRRALDACGIGILTTPVGDRHVVQAMRAHGYALGGEQSGHIVFGGPGAYTGDGLFTALALLELPQARAEGFAKVLGGLRRFPQLLVNVPVRAKPPLDSMPAVQSALRAIEHELGDDGRVVLRYSGTENLCRVMVEGPTTEIVERHAARLADVIRTSL